MGYRTPAALEMAVKAAAKASPMDTGRAIDAFWFHRLLCRVFQDEDSPFVLKGGQSMLARTTDARTTRDIDLVSAGPALNDALAKLLSLSQTDLCDFVVFEFVGATPIKATEEYRSGLRVEFAPMLGPKRLQHIAVDLVVDKIPIGNVERVEPADRINVKGVRVCDYPVYSVEAALADKLCAMLELHGGRPSSRVKDLVDVCVYATTCGVDGDALAHRIRREAGARALSLPPCFSLPKEWETRYRHTYEHLCAQTGLPPALHRLESAEELARTLYNPALENEIPGLTWVPATLSWADA